MEELITSLLRQLHISLLLFVLGVALAAVLKGADLLVDGGVALSVKWGVPKILIGATIVSLGTTLPETVVSVFAALRGAPGLALGNAVGSIIADTGLILGIATLIRPIPVDRRLVGRQSSVQFASALLLVVASVPFASAGWLFEVGGRLPQFVGILFLVLLVIYLWQTLRWSRSAPPDHYDEAFDDIGGATGPSAKTTMVSFTRLLAGLVLVVVGSRILIPTVEELAFRLNIPDAIIAATLVAFGTSLPELVTAVTAVRKGHGELALGNVIGADVLNVLFVSGAAAAVTRGGLSVPPEFFILFFPSMIFVVAILRFGVVTQRGSLGRGFGALLLGAYAVTVVSGYLVRA